MSEAPARRENTSRATFEEPLISIGEASLDRMPALTLIFQDAAAAFTRTLEDFTEIPAALSFEDLDARRVGDLSEKCADLTTTFVYEAQGLASRLTVGVDQEFLDISIELLLGSSVIEPATRNGASPTRIEASLAEFAVRCFLESLGHTLAPIVEARFERDMFGEEAGYAALGQKTAVAIVSRYRLKSLDQQGRLAVILPRAALDPFRPALSRFPGAEGAAQDERWSENLYDHIARTEVIVNVKMEARGFTLDDIAGLEVGDVMRLPIAPTSPIRVESEGRVLFWCTLGQKDGFYTVRLEEFADERRDFLEDILGM